jgi:hypothetical protein
VNALKKLIGKESVDNQADIDRLKKVGFDTASRIAMNFGSPIKLF